MKIRVQYFALLREQARCSQEDVQTQAATPAALFAELGRRHTFSLSPSQLKVAINGDFGSWDQALADNDMVVFIPPVAGG